MGARWRVLEVEENVPFSCTFAVGAWARVPDCFVGHGCSWMFLREGSRRGFLFFTIEVSKYVQKDEPVETGLPSIGERERCRLWLSSWCEDSVDRMLKFNVCQAFVEARDLGL